MPFDNYNTVEPLLMAIPDDRTATLSIMATHLGPHSIEILICGRPSIMAEIFSPNGGHYQGVPLYYNIMCTWNSPVDMSIQASPTVLPGPIDRHRR